jgi:hypothetical protein
MITGVWAVIGLQVDFKDKDGQITKWGRRALVWSAVSVLVAVGAQVFETLNKRREDELSAEKTRIVLNEIRRAVYPVQSVFVTSNLIVPREALPGYAEKLEKAIKDIADRQLLHSDDADVEDNGAGEPTKISVSKEFRFYPEKRTLERALLVDVGLEFRFYKSPIDTDSVRSRFELPRADFEFLVRPTDAEIEYSLLTHRFLSLAMNMEANRKDVHWSSNGKIASLADLDGAQMIVTFESTFGYDRTKIQLLCLAMDIGGRRLLIGSGFVKARNADPKDPVYCFTFPQHVLDADEYVGQDKTANNKVFARGIILKERRHE